MAGSLSLALGVAGIFVPLLPTTPFLLLSAALYMRSSPRLYDWLLRQPCLGAYIRDFRENRAIPLRAKVVSVVLVWLSIGYCILRVAVGAGRPLSARRSHHASYPRVRDPAQRVAVAPVPPVHAAAGRKNAPGASLRGHLSVRRSVRPIRSSAP